MTKTNNTEEKVAPLKQLAKVDLPGYTISDSGIVRDPDGDIVTPYLLGDKLVCDIDGFLTFVADNVLKHFDREPKLWDAVGYRDGDVMNCSLSNLYWYDRHPHAGRKPTPSMPIEPSKSKHWIRRYNVEGQVVAEYSSFTEAVEAAHAERPQFKPSTIATRLRNALKNTDRYYCGTTWRISHPQILEDSYDNKPKTRPEGWIRCYSVPGRELVKQYNSIDEVVRNAEICRTLSPGDVAQRLRECHNGTRKTFRRMIWEVSDPSILQTRQYGMTFVNQLKEEEKQEEPAVVDVVNEVDEVKEVIQPTNEEPTIAPAVNEVDVVVDEVKETEPAEPAESTMETTTNEVIQPQAEETAETPAEPSVVDEVKGETEAQTEEPSKWIKRYDGDVLVATFKDIDEAVAYIQLHDDLKASVKSLRNILRRHLRGIGHSIAGYRYEASGESALYSYEAFKSKQESNLRGWQTRHRRMQEEALAHETVDEVKEEVNNTLNEIEPITPIKEEVKAPKQSSDRPEIEVIVEGDVTSVKVSMIDNGIRIVVTR